MENETVIEESVETQGGEQESGEGTSQGQGGQEGGTSSNQVDPAAYKDLQERYSKLESYWSKIENGANTDPVFKKELERMWKGLPPEQKAEIKKAAQAQAQEKPQGNKELQQLIERQNRMEQLIQSQQHEALRREKFQEVQNETQAVRERFGANDADMKEFWDRYGKMIQNESFNITQQRPGITPQAATQMAYSNHSRNLQAEYMMLMEDRMYDFFGKKIQERNNPLKGINSPAEKAGKAGAGITPTTQERFLAALKKERNPEKRAEMYKAFSEQTGVPIDSFFRSSGG